MKRALKRMPALLSLLFFLALCASLAYWLLQWLAPPPRPVAAPPVAQRSQPPLASAANLFGGNAQGTSLASVQLRGVIRSGRASDSVAIIAAEGKPSRALRANSEVAPGLLLKEIHARTVVLSEKGTERELTLPAFAAQSGGAAEMAVQANPPQPGAQPSSSAVAAQSPVVPGATGQSGGVATASGPGNAVGSEAAGAPAMPTPRPEMRR